MLLFFTSPLKAEPRILLTGGLHRNNFNGSGDEGNRFDYGNGFCLELVAYNQTNNFGWVIYGISRSTHINHVESSEAEATFFTPYYTEMRFYSGQGKSKFFIFLGFDWNRMHFEDTEGADNQYLWSFGLGGHVVLGETLIFQPKVKPYYITSNCLEQEWGIALQANLGLRLGR
jgi:hypothetical protein